MKNTTKEGGPLGLGFLKSSRGGDVERVIHKTAPHGEHRVYLTEDQTNPRQRLYRIQDSEGNHLGFTGEELESLARFYLKEQHRMGKDEDRP